MASPARMTWRDEAACAHTDVCMWPVALSGNAIHQRDHTYAVAAAQAVCRTCTVRGPCLVDAIRWGDIGVRGGLSELERAQCRWRFPTGSPMAVWADQAHRRGVA